MDMEKNTGIQGTVPRNVETEVEDNGRDSCKNVKCVPYLPIKKRGLYVFAKLHFFFTIAAVRLDSVQVNDQTSVQDSDGIGKEVVKIKVLHVIDHMGYGGAPVVVKNIVDFHEGDKVAAYVCALRTNPRAIPIKAKQLNLRYGRYNPCSILAIAKICRQYDIDIVHAHLEKSIVSSLLASFLCSSRIIIHEHGAIFRGGMGFIYRFLLRLLARRSAASIANSEATKPALQQVTNLPDERVHVVYNAVDFIRFERSDYDREESRRSLGISKGMTVVGFVGRLDYCKGADLLLEAAIELLKESDDYHFVVVGDGAEREHLAAQSRKSGLESNVTFTGLLPNPAEAISAFDIAVVPSRREAFGMTTVEFMCMGVPVVASSVGGLPELVRDGQTGILLESLSVQQIVDAVSKLARDDLLREKLTSNAQAFSQQFEVAGQVQKIQEIYIAVYGRDVKGKNQFIKKCESPEQAREEYERALWIHEQLQGSSVSCLQVARPSRHEGRNVYYERITGCVSLRKLICRIDIDESILFKVGRALAQFHKALNPGMENLDQDLKIHGDFWAENVLYSPLDDLVWVVDFSPPHFSREENQQQGTAYEDLAPMIVDLEIKYPLNRVYLLARKKNRQLAESFLKGYEDEIGIKLDCIRLADCVRKWLKAYIRVFEQKNIVSRLFWTRRFRRSVKTYSAGQV